MRRSGVWAWGAGLAFGVILFATPVLAQETDAKQEMAELKAQLKQQQERIQALEARLAAEEKARRTPLVPAKEEASAAKALPKGAAPAEAFWKDGFYLRTPDDKFQLQIGGRALYHGRFFTDDSRNTSSFLNRQIRIFAQGKFFKDWEFKVEGDFVGGEPELQDGYIAWKHWPAASLQVGQFKEPFSMEEMTSTRFIKFTERSPINRIVPGRDLGVQLSGKLWDDRLEYAAAMFNGNGRQNAGGIDTNDDKDAAMRVVVNPFKDDESIWLKGLYVGGSFTWGNQEGGYGDLSMVDSASVWMDIHPSAGNAGTTRREGERMRWGAELAYLVGPFGLRAEYLVDRSDVERNNGTGASVAFPLESRVDTDGYYVQASYWLTGEDESYGKRPTVKKVFAPWSDEGGWGAFEVAARYSTAQMDETVFDDQLANRPVSTGEVNQWAGGLNWWFNPYVRFTTDFYHNHFEDGIVIDNRREKDESLIMTRFQIDF